MTRPRRTKRPLPPRFHPAQTDAHAEWQSARYEANERLRNGTDEFIPVVLAARRALAEHDLHANAARRELLEQARLAAAAAHAAGFAYVDIADALGVKSNTIRNLVQQYHTQLARSANADEPDSDPGEF